MNKRIVILIGAALLLGTWLGAASFAQGMKSATGNEPMMHKSMMMAQEEGAEHWGRGMMGKCPMMSGMMGGMMGKSVVATPDGGIIVLAGKKLMKYDKDLNLVKEVEIKIDMEAMKKDMKEMMKDCPMMKSMMDKGMEEGMEMKSMKKE